MSNKVEKQQQGLQRTVYQNLAEVNKAIVVMAHGAGAGNQHEFMEQFCRTLASFNIQVVSFNFGYMQQMYETGKRRGPNTNKQLVEHFKQELSQIDSTLPIFLAGKSMGGRIATQLASMPELSNKIAGCVALGYPFMPPGKPEKFTDRTEHFTDLHVPLLINQGERDTFGNLTSLASNEHQVVLTNSKLELAWITSGDHSFKPLKSSGITINDNINKAVANTVEFINRII